MIERNELWEPAGKAGIVLGAVSGTYMLVTQWLSLVMASKIGLLWIVNMVLWIAKFAGCLCLMRFFLRKFALSCTEAGISDIRHFGFRIALLSALTYSALYLVDCLYIAPDVISDSLEAAKQQIGPMLDSNTEEAMEQMKDKIPYIGFFFNLIYCTLFGMAVSSIIAPGAAGAEPFSDSGDKDAGADDEPENQ